MAASLRRPIILSRLTWRLDFTRLQNRIARESRVRCVWTKSPSKVSSREEYVEILGKSYVCDAWTNVTPNVISKSDRKLHNCADHPLKILKDHIHRYLYATYRTRWGAPVFTMLDNIEPVVTTEQNFDSLLIPETHISRARSDNYYINKDMVLRAHTSAHQRDLIKAGFDGFIMTGDVYRRDEVDRTHYPVFHQMEGVRLFSKHDLFASYEGSMGIFSNDTKRTAEKQSEHSLEAVKLVEYNLKETLTGIVQHICGKEIDIRWVSAYFPFTHPSWEMEIKYQGEWLELLGCGVMEHGVLKKAGADNRIGWAFGIGLERLAMQLFNIPDIRLFWSQDERFLNQFQSNEIVQFKPFSKYPPVRRDVAFWLSDQYTPNDFYEVVRDVAGDIAEKVELIDKFVHPESERESHCYRITYRSMEKTFTDKEVNVVQDVLRDKLKQRLCVELR